jgi:hypothetical protein
MSSSAELAAKRKGETSRFHCRVNLRGHRFAANAVRCDKYRMRPGRALFWCCHCPNDASSLIGYGAGVGATRLQRCARSSSRKRGSEARR